MRYVLRPPLASSRLPRLGDGEWLGVTDTAWFVAALAVPIAQQAAVALLWRAQLCHGLLTRAFGDVGFAIWGGIFFPLLGGRPLLLLAVGVADAGSLHVHAIPPSAARSERRSFWLCCAAQATSAAHFQFAGRLDPEPDHPHGYDLDRLLDLVVGRRRHRTLARRPSPLFRR